MKTGLPDRFTVESSWFHRVFCSGYSRLTVVDGTVRLLGSRTRTAVKINHIDHIAKVSGWFGRCRLRIRSNARDTFSIGGLDAISADRVVEAVQSVAAQRASELAPRLLEFDQRLQANLRGQEYFRCSSADALHAQLETLVQEGNRELVRLHLPIPAIHALVRLHEFRRRDRLETARERGNSKFVRAQAGAVRTAASGVLEHKLTDEQTHAIATDEDVTLVLAGAGTGKTAVITGKIAYLVRHQEIDPKEILVLAFNRKAAAEIRNRLPSDLQGACVSTFHAFGMRTLGAASGRKPQISILADDPAKMAQTIDQILDDLLTSKQHGDQVRELLTLHRNPYKSPFDFKTGNDYFEYVRRCERRTLNGDLVKSLEEVQIANFLSMNGIKFQYERPYAVKTADKRHRQYMPDFYLRDHKIFIEHFALNEEGDAPPFFRNYQDGVYWKRCIHRRYGTRLIETYSWQARRGILLQELQKLLEHNGVDFRPVSIDRLLDDLRSILVSWLSRLILSFLKHVKTSILSPDDLTRRAMKSPDKFRSLAFLRVFEAVRVRYEKRLTKEGAVDFEDLINEAAGHIRNLRSSAQYRYILVDEFQDISASRMAMLTALKKPDTAYFLVGDDWQSIYRFAGSDVGLVRGCGEYLGHVREHCLSRTFRYGSRVAGPTSEFVQRNPEQTQRSLRANSDELDLGITVVASKEPSQGVERALDDILEQGRTRDQGRSPGHGKNDSSVLALGRYKSSVKAIREVAKSGRMGVDFSTVHSAKGREADFSLVLDLKDDKMGFPSQIDDDPLLNLALPPMRGHPFPHAEERRLFYVAATRAKRAVYLIADQIHTSSFVRELVQDYEGIRRIGDLDPYSAPDCPRCGGYLIESRTGRTLRCVNYPMCKHQAPRCEICEEGYSLSDGRRAKCSNQRCETSPRACPSCKFGILVLRSGPYGRFLGCSAYSYEPPCTHKERLPPGHGLGK